MSPRLLLAIAIGLPFLAPTLAHADADRAFRSKCASCHGADGKGDTAQGKKVKVGDMTSKEWQKLFTDAQMTTSISDGFKREKDGVTQEMKPMKDKLKPEEIAELVKFTRGLAK